MNMPEVDKRYRKVMVEVFEEMDRNGETGEDNKQIFESKVNHRIKFNEVERQFNHQDQNYQPEAQRGLTKKTKRAAPQR